MKKNLLKFGKVDSSMNILITGNMGYVGSQLVKHLKSINKKNKLYGYDTGYFANNCTNDDNLPEVNLDTQFYGDIRKINKNFLKKIDTVIHLSAISNDPMGKSFSKQTKSINLNSSINLAIIASKIGVKHFIFASSCSMYGDGGERPKKETDELNPLTEYAKSKIDFEKFMFKGNLGKMKFTSLRFATACGMSDRLRLDLVLNDFVASAIYKNKIEILSNGQPWRPLIDVSDMCRSIEWAIKRKDNSKKLAINVGQKKNNYKIIDLAKEVQKIFPKVKITVNKKAPNDLRSYAVDFSLYKKLAPNHQPIMTIKKSILRLKDGLKSYNPQTTEFRQSNLMRLKSLEYLIRKNKIDKNLFWK